MAKTKFTLSDYEIMKKREEGETIASIAEKAGVSFGTMQRKLKSLSKETRGVRLYDTLSDGKGGFWTVIEIGDNCFTIKNNVTLKTAKISKRLFNSGETMYRKLDTPPVKVYNLNDPPKETPAEEVKEPAKPILVQPKQARRGYLARIESILDAVKPESQSESQYLYDLVSEIFRSGFDAEFMTEGDK